MATISILAYGNPSAMQTQGSNGTAVLKLSSINRNTKCGPTTATTTTTTTTLSSNNNNNSNVNNKNVNSNNNNNNSDKSTNLNGKLNTSTPNKPNNKRSYSVMAKKQKTLPLSEKTNAITTTVTVATTHQSVTAVRSAKLAKTLKRSLPEIDTNALCRASGGKSKMFPLPVAVARRNARERNRVKQVNNGFAALRERIPEEVAEAFEAQGNGRGSVKKLSKVETLRMAVEYIRSLEKILELDSGTVNDGGSAPQPINDCTLSNESYHLSDTSSVLSTLTPPPSSGSFDDSDCMLPDVTIIDGHQYVRIPGTNTYQLFETNIGVSPTTTSAMYENDENIEPSMLDSHHQHVLLQEQQSSPPTDYSAHDIDAIHCYSVNGNGNNAIYNTPIHILTPASISPSTYSGQSLLSPAPNAAMHDIIPVMATTRTTATAVTAVTATATGTLHTDDDRQPFLTTTTKIIKNECTSMPSNDGNDSDSALYLSSMPTTTHLYDGTTVMTTMKIKDDIDLDEQALSEESMLEAMNWWHSQQAIDNGIPNDAS